MKDAGTRFIGIGTLARELDAAPSTVRLWESRGLIPPAERVDGGRRIWNAAEVERIRELIGARRRETGDVAPLTAAYAPRRPRRLVLDARTMGGADGARQERAVAAGPPSSYPN